LHPHLVADALVPKKKYCILRLQWSANGLSLLVSACFRWLLPCVAFYFSVSTGLLALILLLAVLTCLAMGGLRFAVDVFCVTLTFLASQRLLFLNCPHCIVLIHFLAEDEMSQNKTCSVF